MQFSIGVELGLHCLSLLVHTKGINMGIKEIAEFQGVSEPYLSKIFTKLKKAGIVRSMPGVKGGYELARSADDITLWDVVAAIEGTKPMFQCTEVRRKGVPNQRVHLPPELWKKPCAIHAVMLEAEQKMREFLQSKTLTWLDQRLSAAVPAEAMEASAQWLQEKLARR
ncbi:Rrf2 family transcriptional regulator [Paenibacillus sp.]|uniref:RrF2 family transcriptional regulator n=1 Tax=Paenibacillus sp. TaxID=58172 RepID=UPI002D2D3B0E|nr:Rrf2 family transcriptional regulator [Paenibacillus sp.]HZG56120.1 Rrf2 family transcriptional regulator [Paenibacillus sp.]